MGKNFYNEIIYKYTNIIVGILNWSIRYLRNTYNKEKYSKYYLRFFVNYWLFYWNIKPTYNEFLIIRRLPLVNN